MYDHIFRCVFDWYVMTDLGVTSIIPHAWQVTCFIRHVLRGCVCVETRSNYYYYYYFFFSGNFFGYYCYVQWPLFLGRTFVLLSIRWGGE